MKGPLGPAKFGLGEVIEPFWVGVRRPEVSLQHWDGPGINGQDRVCRGSTWNDNNPNNYVAVYSESLDDCKLKCMSSYGCKVPLRIAVHVVVKNKLVRSASLSLMSWQGCWNELHQTANFVHCYRLSLMFESDQLTKTSIACSFWPHLFWHFSSDDVLNRHLSEEMW